MEGKTRGLSLRTVSHSLRTAGVLWAGQHRLYKFLYLYTCHSLTPRHCGPRIRPTTTWIASTHRHQSWPWHSPTNRSAGAPPKICAASALSFSTSALVVQITPCTSASMWPRNTGALTSASPRSWSGRRRPCVACNPFLPAQDQTNHERSQTHVAPWRPPLARPALATSPACRLLPPDRRPPQYPTTLVDRTRV